MNDTRTPGFNPALLGTYAPRNGTDDGPTPALKFTSDGTDAFTIGTGDVTFATHGVYTLRGINEPPLGMPVPRPTIEVTARIAPLTARDAVDAVLRARADLREVLHPVFLEGTADCELRDERAARWSLSDARLYVEKDGDMRLRSGYSDHVEPHAVDGLTFFVWREAAEEPDVLYVFDNAKRVGDGT